MTTTTGALRETDPSFDAFYRREVRALIGLAFVLSGSRVGAEDIAHDALAAAAQRWPEVSQLDNPGAWVRRVVANRSVSAVRRRVSEAKVHLRMLARREVVVVAELPADSAELWRLVRALPPRQAQVVALKALDGLSLQEIAEVLGLSKETVNTHWRRAREVLAAHLKEEDR